MYEYVTLNGRTIREHGRPRAGKGRDMTYTQDNTLREGIVEGVSYFALIVVGLGALLFFAWKWDSARTNETVQKSADALVRDIDAQLPPGTPRSDIEKFLIAHPRSRATSTIVGRIQWSKGLQQSFIPGLRPWATRSTVVPSYSTSDWTVRTR